MLVPGNQACNWTSLQPASEYLALQELAITQVQVACNVKNMKLIWGRGKVACRNWVGWPGTNAGVINNETSCFSLCLQVAEVQAFDTWATAALSELPGFGFKLL